MSKKLILDLAHARAGDKGNISNISVWVYEAKDYPIIQKALCPKRLKRLFPKLLKGKIDLYELPSLNGFNLVFFDALEGGVNTSLNLDGHGKSWSSLLLSLPIDPDDVV